MTFGRTHEQWELMTPAQLDVLAEQHAIAHDPKRRGAAAEQGTVDDLRAFAGARG